MDLGGLTVPLPTQFAEDGAIDLGRNTRFARSISEAGAAHLFVLGSLGEFPSVTDAERTRLVDTVVESATGRTDVWVGVGAPSTARAVAYADEAEGLGAAAVIAVPPYYLRPTEAAIERYYRALAAAVSVPVLAYNIPSLVGYSLEPGLVGRLAADRTIAGIKDTEPDLTRLRAFLSVGPPGFAVVPGNDRLATRAMAEGAVGAVMGTANVVPALAAELVRSARAGEADAAGRLQETIDGLAEAVDSGPFPSTVKFLAREFWGADVGYRSPYDALTDTEAAAVRARFEPLKASLEPYRTR